MSGVVTCERLSHPGTYLGLGEFRMALGNHRRLELPCERAKRVSDSQAVFDAQGADGIELRRNGPRIIHGPKCETAANAWQARSDG